jgi:hypothetical protein
MKAIFPPTAERVKINTNEKINNRIREETIANIARYSNRGIDEVNERLKELDEEWDIERVVETHASSLIILSALLGFTVNKKWFLVSGVAGGFLLQHALTGWCPPISIFRRLGIRTISEINHEKESLEIQILNSRPRVY